MTVVFVSVSYLGICNYKLCARVLFPQLLKLCVKLPPVRAITLEEMYFKWSFHFSHNPQRLLRVLATYLQSPMNLCL